MASIKFKPARCDIECERGAGLHPSAFTWTSGGALVDLTGASAVLELAVDGVSVYTASTATGEITLGDELGTVEIDIDVEEIDAFDFETADYELRITLSDGATYKLLRGSFIVIEGITHW